MIITDFSSLSISGETLTREQCVGVLNYPDEDIMRLIHMAYQVRHKYYGNHVNVQVLRNAKSGYCSEDCRYCSQSSISQAPIEKYTLVSKSTLVKEAIRAEQIKATRFCLSTSGNRPTDGEIEVLSDIVRSVKTITSLPVCASLGLLTNQQAAALKAAGLDRVNHNLNTSRRYYPEICTTHSFQDRLDTITCCQTAGLEVCSGGIIGQGETDDDIIDMLLTLREINPQAIPINFLIPIEGTPFQGLEGGLTPIRCLKVLSLARLLNPQCEVRAAGGWEYHLRNLQPLALYIVDSIFVDGYLTTKGTSVSEVCDMIADMGFESTIEDPGLENPL